MFWMEEEPRLGYLHMVSGKLCHSEAIVSLWREQCFFVYRHCHCLDLTHSLKFNFDPR